MGAFSNASAGDKEYGRLKYNPEIISKFASYAPLPKDVDIYFSGPVDRPYGVIGIAKEVHGGKKSGFIQRYAFPMKLLGNK